MINVNQLYLEVKNKWNSLYPIYFDSTKTISQGIFYILYKQIGRRLPKNLCIQNPKIQQLAIAVGSLQLRNILEPHKMYSRDYFNVGRLKVQLNNDNHQPLKNDVPSSIHICYMKIEKVLLIKIGEKLKELRKKK